MILLRNKLKKTNFNPEKILSIAKTISLGLPEDYQEKHWKKIICTGLIIKEHHKTLNTEALFLYSLFHDSLRDQNKNDSHYGERASNYLHSLYCETSLLNYTTANIAIEACFYQENPKKIQNSQIVYLYDAHTLSEKTINTNLLNSNFSKNKKLHTFLQNQKFESIPWSELFEKCKN